MSITFMLSVAYVHINVIKRSHNDWI